MGYANSKTRILAVYEILKSMSDEEHPVNAKLIIDELGKSGYDCERKTVYSDIEALNDYGIEVLHTDYPRKGYFLADRSFEVSEIGLLIDAVLSANFITPKKTIQLVEKLKEFLSKNQYAEVLKNTFINNRKKCDNEEIFYNIDTIRKAIKKKKKVSLSYYKHTLKSGHFIEKSYKTMVVSPYALLWQDDFYYLVCNNQKYNNLMHLRLDRIKKAEILDEDFRHFSEVSEYTDEFNISDYASKTFNMFSGVAEDITLKCNINILNQVIDKFGNDIFVRTSDDNHLIFDSKVYISEGFIGWILSFGKEIEVLKPLSLREKVSKEINEIYGIYNN